LSQQSNARIHRWNRPSQRGDRPSIRWVARLRRGKTTGDRVTDFMLVQYGNVTGEHEQIYRRLQEDLKPGQQVLVVESTKVKRVAKWRPGHEFFPPRSYTESWTTMHFGVLEGAINFYLANPAVLLPMAKHVTFRRHEPGEVFVAPSSWSLHDGDIRLEPRIIELYDMTMIGATQRLLEGALSGEEKSVIICSGRDVPRYFSNRGETRPIYAEALGLLKLPITQKLAGEYAKYRLREAERSR